MKTIRRLKQSEKLKGIKEKYDRLMAQHKQVLQKKKLAERALKISESQLKASEERNRVLKEKDAKIRSEFLKSQQTIYDLKDTQETFLIGKEVKCKKGRLKGKILKVVAVKLSACIMSAE